VEDPSEDLLCSRRVQLHVFPDKAGDIPAPVIDTESGWARTGNMERVARAPVAAHHRLEDPRAPRIADIVKVHLPR